MTAAEDVPSVVKAGAGYGKLGFSTAPVEVNNGGITDFDGSETDPENPEQRFDVYISLKREGEKLWFDEMLLVKSDKADTLESNASAAAENERN